MPGLIGSSCCRICINFICNIAVATSCSGRRLWHCECCLNSPQNRHQCATAAAEAATRWNFATRPRFADRLGEGGRAEKRSKKVPLKYEKIYLATSRASSSVVDRRRVVAWSQIANRRSIMISSSIFNEFALAPEESTKKQHKQVTFCMRKASQLKVKEKTTTIACPATAHDRCADRMRRCLTQFRFLMGCQRPLPLPKKKKRTKLTKKIAPSIFSSPNRTGDRSYDRWSVWSFDRLINSSLLCAIFGLLVLILSLDFHAQLMFMTSDCVAAITQLDSSRSSVQLQLHSLPQNVAHT